jgi:hypothetical protein
MSIIIARRKLAAHFHDDLLGVREQRLVSMAGSSFQNELKGIVLCP